MKIAIVTASPPGEMGVGQNYIAALASALSGHEIFTIALLRHESDWNDSDRALSSDYRIEPQRYESPRSIGPGKIGQWTASLGMRWVAIPNAAKTVQRVAETLDEHEIDRVLFVLESPQLILMAAAMSRRFADRLCVLVWDHPEHVLSLFGHRGSTRKRLLSRFHDAVSSARSAITVSSALARHLHQINPHLTTRLFRCPVSPERFPPHSDADNETSTFAIGFAGSVTAPDELENLQQALDIVDWRIEDRAVELCLLGKRFKLVSRTSRNIRYHGFVPTQADVADRLAACDICFLPQPFRSKDRWFTEFSFPTKSSIYLASGRPILVNAPDYGTLPGFGRTDCETPGLSRFGFQCLSPAPQDILEIVRRIASDPSFYQQGWSLAAECARGAFNVDDGRRAVCDALDIPNADNLATHNRQTAVDRR